MRTYRPAARPISKADKVDLMTPLVVLLAIGFCGSLFGNIQMIQGVKAQQDREQKAMLCFDYTGAVTFDEDWKECRVVTVRTPVESSQ